MTEPENEFLPVIPPDTEQLPADDSTAPKPGRWFWVTHTDATEPRWLGCVTHLGSNYVHLEGPYWKKRVHIDHFESLCEFIPEPDKIIQGYIGEYQAQVLELMAKVKEITARLSVTTDPVLSAGPGAVVPEASTLSVYNGQAMDAYKAALVHAKEKALPDLFKEIGEANEALAKWMGATLIPLKAQAEALKPAIKAIENRIFSVQLYAGLVEEVVQIADGDPAPVNEKIRLFQRRCYMDEECLAQYEVGGMEFADLPDFDRWLVRPDNLARLLPYPRCIVAFKVRRNAKQRIATNLGELLQIIEDQKYDELTFLFIRNGAQVFRLGTAIEFGSKLFPDMGRQALDGKLYADASGGDSSINVISENEWKGMREAERKKEREIEDRERAMAKLSKKEREKQGYYFSDYVNRRSERYRPFTHDNVYYDDIAKHIQAMITKHNRLVLVLQGLLDRSPVLHPHPKWSLWSNTGFDLALELIYDDARALVAGEKPDFEAYRKRLNATLKAGCVTVGQEMGWMRAEAKKENERRSRRGGRDYYPELFRPYGNPGPGKLATVVRAGTKVCTYTWVRKRERNTDDGGPKEIGCTFTTNKESVLNVTAYKPGDFKQFFNDPRTRTEYLQWAWLLLEAEEYHAGNRKVAPVTEMPKRNKTKYGSYEYRQRKERKALVGKAVRLTRRITTKGGDAYEKGSLWRVDFNWGSTFNIQGINADGTPETYEDYKDRRYVAQVRSYDFAVDPTIPPAPKPPPKPKKAPEPEEDEEDEETPTDEPESAPEGDADEDEASDDEAEEPSDPDSLGDLSDLDDGPEEVPSSDDE